MQRILTALMLGIILYFFAMGAHDFQTGLKESFHFQVAVVLQIFVIIMMLVWAFTNFCPSTWLMSKIFPPCEWEK
jgi:amino acid transporter